MRVASDDMVRQANPPSGFEPIVSSSPFGWENGPIFEVTNEGGWRRGFRVAERHSNAGGMCHGGMLMTFADILLSRAVMDAVDPPFVTVRMITDFVGPACKGDWVEGSANVMGVTDGLVSVVGEIKTRNTPVANLNAMFKTLGRRG